MSSNNSWIPSPDPKQEKAKQQVAKAEKHRRYNSKRKYKRQVMNEYKRLQHLGSEPAVIQTPAPVTGSQVVPLDIAALIAAQESLRQKKQARLEKAKQRSALEHDKVQKGIDSLIKEGVKEKKAAYQTFREDNREILAREEAYDAEDSATFDFIFKHAIQLGTPSASVANSPASTRPNSPLTRACSDPMGIYNHFDNESAHGSPEQDTGNTADTEANTADAEGARAPVMDSTTKKKKAPVATRLAFSPVDEAKESRMPNASIMNALIIVGRCNDDEAGSLLPLESTPDQVIQLGNVTCCRFGDKMQFFYLKTDTDQAKMPSVHGSWLSSFFRLGSSSSKNPIEQDESSDEENAKGVAKHDFDDDKGIAYIASGTLDTGDGGECHFLAVLATLDGATSLYKLESNPDFGPPQFVNIAQIPKEYWFEHEDEVDSQELVSVHFGGNYLVAVDTSRVVRILSMDWEDGTTPTIGIHGVSTQGPVGTRNVGIACSDNSILAWADSKSRKNSRARGVFYSSNVVGDKVDLWKNRVEDIKGLNAASGVAAHHGYLVLDASGKIHIGFFDSETGNIQGWKAIDKTPKIGIVGGAADCFMAMALDKPGEVYLFHGRPGEIEAKLSLANVVKRFDAAGGWTIKKVLDMDGSSTRLSFHIQLTPSVDDEQEDSKPAAKSTKITNRKQQEEDVKEGSTKASAATPTRKRAGATRKTTPAKMPAVATKKTGDETETSSFNPSKKHRVEAAAKHDDETKGLDDQGVASLEQTYMEKLETAKSLAKAKRTKAINNILTEMVHQNNNNPGALFKEDVMPSLMVAIAEALGYSKRHAKRSLAAKTLKAYCKKEGLIS